MKEIKIINIFVFNIKKNYEAQFQNFKNKRKLGPITTRKRRFLLKCELLDRSS